MAVHELFGVLTVMVLVAAFTAAISPKAQTGSVIQASSAGFNQVLGTALSPVTGG